MSHTVEALKFSRGKGLDDALVENANFTVLESATLFGLPAASKNSERRRPDPLIREMPKSEPFPISSLGRALAPAVKRSIETIKAPDALCAQSFLAAASLAVQGHRNIVIDGRVYPLSQFFLTVGESGERKSHTDKEALRPHRAKQDRLRENWEVSTKEFGVRKATFEKLKGDKIREALTPEEGVKAIAELGKEPEPPILPILLIEEPTLEGIHKLLERGQPSIGLFSDEAGRMLGGYGMSDDQQLKTAAGLCELWDGKQISRVRAGDGASVMNGRRLSMHLMAQSMVAQRLLGNQLLLNQGLPSRVLPAFPASTAGSRSYESVDLTRDQSILAYQRRITEILDQSFPLVEGRSNELQPKSLEISADAKNLWIKFYNDIESQLRDGEPLAVIRGFASKVPEHVLRMAGVLTCVENLEASDVKVSEMAAAIEIVQYYLGESLRIFHTGGMDPELSLAQRLLEWASSRKRIYPVLVYQQGPNQIRDKKTAHKVLTILENHGWLTRVQGGANLDGAHRKDVWEVFSDGSV